MPKLLSDSYLYNKFPEYNKSLYVFIMTAETIDKDDESFEEIIREVKSRRVSNGVLNALRNHNIILKYNGTALPKQFKVFVAKDIRNDKKRKVFIDCSEIIRKINGHLVCTNIDILIAHIISAAIHLVYYTEKASVRIINRGLEYSAESFARLFTAIVDYIYKISVVGTQKAKCMYMAAMYYMVNIINHEETTSIKNYARKISGISEREADLLELGMPDMYSNLKVFIDSLAKNLKLNKMTLDIVVSRWMQMYGVGTALALELFPAFATMLTDAYVGCYINNQKTIEKIASRSFVEASKGYLASINEVI